jgi:DNA-binding MarR family transcriptional regulator
MSNTVNQSFYLSLLEFVMTTKQQIISIATEFGLTGIQAITLLMIDEDRPRPMKNFCAVFHCDASNVTGIVDGLERKGLVTRENDLSDRRVKVIKLEAAGKGMRRTILDRLDADNDFLFAPLSPEERSQFVNILEKLVAASKTTCAKME